MCDHHDLDDEHHDELSVDVAWVTLDANGSSTGLTIIDHTTDGTAHFACDGFAANDGGRVFLAENHTLDLPNCFRSEEESLVAVRKSDGSTETLIPRIDAAEGLDGCSEDIDNTTHLEASSDGSQVFASFDSAASGGSGRLLFSPAGNQRHRRVLLAGRFRDLHATGDHQPGRHAGADQLLIGGVSRAQPAAFRSRRRRVVARSLPRRAPGDGPADLLSEPSWRRGIEPGGPGVADSNQRAPCPPTAFRAQPCAGVRGDRSGLHRPVPGTPALSRRAPRKVAGESWKMVLWRIPAPRTRREINATPNDSSPAGRQRPRPFIIPWTFGRGLQ